MLSPTVIGAGTGMLVGDAVGWAWVRCGEYNARDACLITKVSHKTGIAAGAGAGTLLWADRKFGNPPSIRQ